MHSEKRVQVSPVVIEAHPEDGCRVVRARDNVDGLSRAPVRRTRGDRIGVTALTELPGNLMARLHCELHFGGRRFLTDPFLDLHWSPTWPFTFHGTRVCNPHRPGLFRTPYDASNHLGIG